MQKSHFVKGFAIFGWLAYTVGSYVGASTYDPGLIQLLFAGLLMVSGVFMLDRHLLRNNTSGWRKWTQRLTYLAHFLFIPGFVAVGTYGFQPGLVQNICIRGAYFAVLLYALTFLTTIVCKLKRQNAARDKGLPQ